jgi:hypothetical protein
MLQQSRAGAMMSSFSCFDSSDLHALNQGSSSPPEHSSAFPSRCPMLPFTIPRMNKKPMQSARNQAPTDQSTPGVAESTMPKSLTIQDSLQIKPAEYWLKLGEADQALKEVNSENPLLFLLTPTSSSTGSLLKVMWLAWLYPLPSSSKPQFVRP